jgi:hypothetical protein
MHAAGFSAVSPRLQSVAGEVDIGMVVPGPGQGAVESVLRDARADAGAVAAALAAAGQAVAGARQRLEVARRRRADAMVALETATDEVGRQEGRLAEQARKAAEARVRLGELERVRAVRQQAKQKLDARVAKLAGAAAALRSRSAELRRLIRQEELARRRAAGGGGGSIHGSGRRCDLSGTSPAEYWIIMRESSGYPTADNPTSTAFGLGQLLLGNRILYLGNQYATTDCGRQQWAFRAYVRDRYGTAARAKAFWQANGWY